jgi:hypothetical protein
MKVLASLKGSCLVRCGASWRGAVAISAHDRAGSRSSGGGSDRVASGASAKAILRCNLGR